LRYTASPTCEILAPLCSDAIKLLNKYGEYLGDLLQMCQYNISIHLVRCSVRSFVLNDGVIIAGDGSKTPALAAVLLLSLFLIGGAYCDICAMQKLLPLF